MHLVININADPDPDPRHLLLQERIMETEEIQHQLQKNLESTLQEIVDLDAHIEMLKARDLVNRKTYIDSFLIWMKK
jgi:hypothetical protein